MFMKVKKRTLYQYILIYMMLLFNQSNLYQVFIYPNQILVFLIVVFLMGILLFSYKKIGLKVSWIVISFLFFTVMIRLVKGGIGIIFWCEIALKIVIVYLAILKDKEYFIDRFVKIVFILAGISIIFWLLQSLGINLAQKFFYHYFTQGTYAVYDKNWNRMLYNYEGYGIFIYTYLSAYPNRNVSIFTEPGVYQSVLNTALFCIVIFPEYIYITKKKLLRIFIVIFIAIITSQSTSGYFGLCAVLITILFRNKNNNWKRYILKLLILGIAIIGIDYIIRGNESLIEVAFLSKVFNTSKEFSLVAKNSTGIWRVATLQMSILAMLKYPMGLGVDGWNEFMRSNFYSGPGGWPFKLGAILGIIPFFLLLYWLFVPLKYLKKDYYAIVLFVFLYFNTTIAQTSAFYPVVILIPVYLNFMKYNINKNEKYFLRYQD